MKFLVALFGLLWAAGNLLVAYLFLTSGMLPKTVAKGIMVQGALLSGGLLLALFAVILIVQSLILVVSRPKTV
jgi:hypothetical protein